MAMRYSATEFFQKKMQNPVGAAAGCDLLTLILNSKTRSKDRSLRQLLQGFLRLRVYSHFNGHPHRPIYQDGIS
ncbi:hypothetical protein [Pseudomonas sp.]|jgi:hypothetical protein|uniref:hypothetical protein n=1 Tax=Pseudomonas sp. TaxID=306 RepID=UPI002E2F4CF8|nr:hypothetical protein [Pseudomonas sp.]HEX4550734.1 hypothetical protein [Pseudomonas sp.]